ncbi:MAG: signal peptide peptidase SppA [Deltaproteobacteria bacterium]|nr:signal peptide peptidase SppA [Deltaproteobacteria bacterium]
MRRHPILLSFLVVFLILFFLAGVFVVVVALTGGDGAKWLPLGDIAIVEIEGPIFDSTDIIKELHRYGENSSIKAVVLRIDSPGGAVAPSQEIFEEVKKLKKTKKVVVSLGTVGASGAYYIACAADKIIASPGTITGSIGVIMESMSFHEVLKWARLENRVIKSGEYKDVGSPFREMLPGERAYLQAILDNMYGQFKNAVAENRGFSQEQIDLIAEGKIYTGEQAMTQKLVDGLGTLYDAIDEAKKLAGLSPDARVIWPRKDKFPFESLLFDSMEKNSLEHFVKKYFHGMDAPVWLYSMNPLKID